MFGVNNETKVPYTNNERVSLLVFFFVFFLNEDLGQYPILPHLAKFIGFNISHYYVSCFNSTVQCVALCLLRLSPAQSSTMH